MNSIDKGHSRTLFIAYVGLAIAFIAISAWVVIPLGPVPFTLQMFAVPLMICLLSPKEAITAIYLYVGLGCIGLPIFSGMRAGIGVIMGPTGGFLIGYLVSVPLACGFLYLVNQHAKKSSHPSVLGRVLMNVIAGLIFTSIAYIFGTIQYMNIAAVDLGVALATSVLPFIIPDIIKIVIAAVCAASVNSMVQVGPYAQRSSH